MTLDDFYSEWRSASPTVSVHTSGSTGEPKEMAVEKSRMLASAKATCDFLGLSPGDTALLCMPLQYIGAKMMVVRAEERGMELVDAGASGHPLAGLSAAPDFAAMVPLQAYNSLSVPAERLLFSQIRHVLIGGGAIDPGLEETLAAMPNAVWSTYGMTETLSHIALRRVSGPGRSHWYTPLGNVSVDVDSSGCLVVDAPDLCRGRLVTGDLAEMAPDGRGFRILGRKGNVVVSGGVKIHMEEVERLLCGRLPFPYMATKRKDAKFGEILVLLVCSEDTAAVVAACAECLPKYFRPRLVVPVGSLPVAGNGKPDRARAELIAAGHGC